MKALSILTTACVLLAAPVFAQEMDHSMHGMTMDHGTHQAPGDPEPVPGNSPPPASAQNMAAARYYGADAMAEADRKLRQEHGGMTTYQIMFNLAEYRAQKGRDGYRWDGEAWIGGDIHRLTIKTEGEGGFDRKLEQAEVQALYSRALDPYWNLQAGVRYDITPNPSRTYAAIGVEGLAPYWFEVEGALFLSDKGDLTGRAEAYYDQRITQNLVLQPRVELNFAAQDVRELGTGAGLSDAELGLRLRYEKVREFAPYVGLSWERKLGRTARFARADGDDIGGASVVFGVRTWF